MCICRCVTETTNCTVQRQRYLHSVFVTTTRCYSNINKRLIINYVGTARELRHPEWRLSLVNFALLVSRWRQIEQRAAWRHVATPTLCSLLLLILRSVKNKYANILLNTQPRLHFAGPAEACHQLRNLDSGNRQTEKQNETHRNKWIIVVTDWIWRVVSLAAAEVCQRTPNWKLLWAGSLRLRHRTAAVYRQHSHSLSAVHFYNLRVHAARTLLDQRAFQTVTLGWEVLQSGGHPDGAERMR